MGGQDQLPRLLDDLCALVLGILRPQSLPAPLPPAAGRGRPRRVSPAGLASLLLGASLALMLCGSVTFMIGFILMPWVLGLVMVLYFLGMVSSLSSLWRSLLVPAPASSPSSPRKGSGQLFSKFPIV